METSQIFHLQNIHHTYTYINIKSILSLLDPEDVENFQKNCNFN